MNRREWLAGTAALLGAGQAHAFGLGKLGARGGFGSLGGVGGKALPPGAWAPGAAVTFDFASSSYTGGSLASMLSVTQAATTYAASASGSLVAFAPNTPRITSKGLLLESAATNLQLGSNLLSDSTNYWTPANSTVSAGAADPAVGGLVPYTLNEGAAAGVGHNINTKAATGASVTAGNFYCVSALVKAGTNSKIQLSHSTVSFTGFWAANFNFSGDGNPQIQTTGGTSGSGCEHLGNGLYLLWYVQQAVVTNATGGGAVVTHTNSMSLVRNGTYTGTSKTVICYGVQYEQVAGLSSRPSSFIPTTTVAVTRAADVATLSGAAPTALASATGSLLIGALDGSPGVAETLIDANGVALIGKTSGNLLTTAITSPLNSGNAGTWTLKSKAFLSWSPAGRSLTLNDNVAVTDAVAVTPSAPFTLPGTGGYISKLAIWSSVIANALVRLPFEGPLTAWGDSLTAGTLDFGNAYTMPVALKDRNSLNSAGMRIISNQGVSGNTSTQILTRFNAASATWNTGTIIWAGRNNYTSGATVKADIATMVASLLTNQYIVLGITNKADGSEDIGDANYNTMIALNSDLAAIYGSRFLDILPILVAAYNPANALDVIDNANGCIPFTLRSNYFNGTVQTTTINPGDTSFTVSNTFGPIGVGWIITLGTEFIYVTATNGTLVSSCVRGYGGTTPGTYAPGTNYKACDVLHIGVEGDKVVADAIKAKIAAVGPF